MITAQYFEPDKIMNPTEHSKLLSEIEVFRLSFGEQWSAYFNHNTNSIQFLLYLANSHKEQQPFGRVEFSEIVQFEFNHCLSQYRGSYDQLWNEFIPSILNCIKAVEQCSKAKEHVSNILTALQNMPKLKECIMTNFNEATVATLNELFTIDIHSSLSSTPRSFTPDISICSADDVTVTPADTVTKKMKQMQIQQNGTYKAIIKMTLRCLQIFPCLLSIPMDSVVINNYLDALVSEEYWAPAVSVIKLYPSQISHSSVTSLLQLLVAAKEWEVAVDLVLHFFLSSGSVSSSSVSNNVFSTQIHTKLSTSDTRGSVSAAAADRHASDASSNGLLDSDNITSMSNVSAEMISSMADSLVSDCLEENTNASLKAAGRVAEASRNNDLIAQIKFLAQKLKFVGFVKKGKWQLILQTVYAKGLDAQRCLYECLLEDGQYIEAKIVYSRFTSLAHFKVPSVPPDLVEKQLQFKRDTYMRFPAEKVKIVVVNNYDTLTYAAEVLGISLAAVSANNTPSSTNKSVQSSLLTLHSVLNIRPTTNGSSSSGMNINSGVMSGSDVAVSRTLYSMTALRLSQVVAGVCGDNATVSHKDNTVSQTAAMETPVVVRIETSTLDATSTEVNSVSTGSRSRNNSSSSAASTDSKDPSPTKRQRRPRKPNDVTAASSSSSSSGSVSDASKYAAVAAKSINDVLVSRRNAQKTSSSVAPNIDRFRLLVGLDSEWKVVMYGGGTESLGASILQIASPDHAFIFDLNALGKVKNTSPTPTAASNNRHNSYNGNNGNNNFRYQQQNTSKFSGGNTSASNSGGYGKPAANSSSQKSNQQQSMSKQQPHIITGVLPLFEMTELFLYRLFADKGVLKVGWGFMNEDCKMIRKAANGRFGQVLNRIESFVDLDDVVTKEDMQLRVKNTASGEECSKSLSNACQRYLGRPLDKFEQLSDWDAQPLSLSQQQYASLDAHSLLGILDAMLLEKQITSPLHIATALYGASQHVQESIMLLNSGKK